MRIILIGLFLSLVIPFPVQAEEGEKAPQETQTAQEAAQLEKSPEQILAELSTEYPMFRFVTNQGTFVVELDARKAPLTVANFYSYVKSGFYNDTLFHRVINGFVAQGGGINSAYEAKKEGKPIPNESGNGLKNVRGTIAMARTAKPHSGTSQFFFNLDNNADLDPLPTRWGYAVFGKVVEDMDDGIAVLDRIAHLPTGPSPDGSLTSDVPQTPVIVKSVTLIP